MNYEERYLAEVAKNAELRAQLKVLSQTIDDLGLELATLRAQNERKAAANRERVKRHRQKSASHKDKRTLNEKHNDDRNTSN